jgi:hypothetical protein
VAGRENPYARIYAASRMPKLKHLIKKGRDYSEELIEGAVKNTFKYKKKDDL